MITKITADNRVAYEALFAKANDYLDLELTDPGYIDSLNKYFLQLKGLVQRLNSDDDNREKIKQFIRLPLDEPTFSIDANSRVITVPAEFKKNGISVKDDEIAETLYFTIDRYYDSIDLMSDDVNIVIQWETPDKINGISTALFRDCAVLDGSEKVVFGWAISNKITRTAGTVKFAARFYILNGETITFNLNTLVQSATIQAGINYDVTGAQLNDQARILSRLTTGPAVPADDVSLEAPVFVHDLVIDAQAADPTHQFIDLADLVESDGKLKAVAKIPNGPGTLLYQWNITDKNNITSTDFGHFDYFAEEVYHDGVVYYEKTIDDTYQITEEDLTSYEDGDAFDEGLELFSKGASLPVSAVGKYQLEARNYNASADPAQGNYKSTLSNLIEVRRPDPIVEVRLNDELAVVAEGNDLHAVPVILDPAGSTDLTIALADGQAGDTVDFTLADVTEDLIENEESVLFAAVETTKVMDGENKTSLTQTITNPTIDQLTKVHLVKANYNISRNNDNDHPSGDYYFKCAGAPATPTAITLNSTSPRVPATISVENFTTNGYIERVKYVWMKAQIEYTGENAGYDWDVSNDTTIVAQGEIEPNGTIPAITVDEPGLYYCECGNCYIMECTSYNLMECSNCHKDIGFENPY